MLGKLIKYDLKSGQRYFVPTYGIMLVLAVIIGITSRSQIHSDTASVILNVSTLLFFMLVFGAVLLTIYLLVERFYHNLLGNEGYLMFALPVSTAQHIVSKIITALIWMLLGCVMVILSGLIITLLGMSGNEFMQLCSEFAQLFTNIHIEGSDVLMFFRVMMLMVLAVIALLTKLYACIAIGHLWSGHRILGAFLAFVGLLILSTFVSGYWNELLGALEYDLAGSIYMILCIALYGVVTWYILDRHLNLD